MQAVQKYDMAAQIAASRFPWEAAALVRDELAIVICNRSAAYFAAGDFISALADADAVIQLKRPWSKGHFRRAKALLGLGQLQDAKESAELGLQFEPDSKVFPLVIRLLQDSAPHSVSMQELSSFVSEIDDLIAKGNPS
jgi:translocation protein SEC72